MPFAWSKEGDDHVATIDAAKGDIVDWLGVLVGWKGQVEAKFLQKYADVVKGTLGALMAGPFEKFVKQWKSLRVATVKFRFPIANPVYFSVVAHIGRNQSVEEYLIAELRETDDVIGLDVNGNPTLKLIAPPAPQSVPAPSAAPAPSPVPPPTALDPAQCATIAADASAAFEAAGANVVAALDRLQQVAAQAALGAAARRTQAALQQLVEVGKSIKS